jgi:hypothetical protein
MPNAPLGVSSQSNKKLKWGGKASFQALADGKENRVDGIDSIGSEYCDNSARPEAPPPKTPAAASRIPLEDLIANTEDAYNVEAPAATPIDHVLWQSNPDSSDLSRAAGATQRSRKRAHSSSPSSSQQYDANNDSLNLDTLNKSLRTPNNDPTQDLWNRYTTANASKEPTLPTYAHLLPSSPQTPNSKDLRRTHSCGVEWPTSKSKRRRLEQQHSRTKELFAASRKDILRRDISNNTRVGLLLEKIQESMTKRTTVAEDPSSSSPLPDRHYQSVASPSRARMDARSTTSDIPNGSHSPSKGSPLKQPNQREKSFSDFSDEDLDLEAFETVEKELAQTHTQAQKISPELEPQRPDLAPSNGVQSRTKWQTDGTNDLSQQQIPQGSSLATESKTLSNGSFDEFDDDDDDDLMNKIIDLASKYDSQPQGQSGVLEPQPLQDAQTRHLETLDEFEDAFDDDDDLWEGIADATSLKTKTLPGTGNNVRPQ